MEGTGFRDNSSSSHSGGGSDRGNSPSRSHRHHHHNNNSHGAGGGGSFLPGALFGAVGGALGTSWWTSRGQQNQQQQQRQPFYNPAQPSPHPNYNAVPPLHQQPYPGPVPPAQQHHSYYFPHVHMPAPPPTPARKRACSFSCCMVVLLLLGVLIAALIVPKPGANNIVLVAGDRRLVSVNTKWFRQVSVSGAVDVDTYMFHQVPPLSDTVHLSKKIDIKLERGSYHFVRFDVHKGSSIAAEWEFSDFTQPPSFGIIEGQQSFDEWRTGSNVRFAYDRNSAHGSYTFKAPRRAEYYLVFYTSRSWLRAVGNASFEVDSVTYSLKPAAGRCDPPPSSPAPRPDCEFALDNDNDAYLLFVAPLTDDSYAVTYHTTARRDAYTALFATLASLFAVFFVISLMAWCGVRCCAWVLCGERRVRGRYQYQAIADEGNAATRLEAHPGNDAVPAQPPFNPGFQHQPPAPAAPTVPPSAPPPYSVFDPTAA
ncbi:hypothetical protein HDU87_001382 [Geranomyces variabilis]|uniref:GOLD domain-containing protein n=1 Tax=Geranomyces variabilis TaxID=109894 RepID=A0AAD5XTY9_9FUNG|nr:hypothetical protein HDU87_001382 [Geranomyces variabilis]